MNKPDCCPAVPENPSMDATAGDECVPPFSRKYVDMQGLIEGAEQIEIVFYECRLYNR